MGHGTGTYLGPGLVRDVPPGQQVLFTSKIRLEIDAFDSHIHRNLTCSTRLGASQNKNNACVGRDMRVLDDDLATGSNGSSNSV